MTTMVGPGPGAGPGPGPGPNCCRWSVSELRAVWRLCDPRCTGWVKVSHLQQLATLHVTDVTKEVGELLRHLDPQQKGAISFRDFCLGVRSLLRYQRQRHQSQPPPTDSMMSPAPSARFVLTSPGQREAVDVSDSEQYECYGEQPQHDPDLDSGISTERPPIASTRHTWLRTSLRRSPPSHQEAEALPNRRWGSFRHSGRRQLGSNALASQLYRSSSFNSSGRSSTCDTADDVYSDVSLEEDVLDLNHKVQMLQQQVGVLSEAGDERYARAKAEAAALQARVHMLEEQLSQQEARHELAMVEEQRRGRELVARVEREARRCQEQAAIGQQQAEQAQQQAQQEAARHRGRADRLEAERTELQQQLQEARSQLQHEAAVARDADRRLVHQQAANSELVDELRRQIEQLRSDSVCASSVLQQELATLRADNKRLLDTSEELQAALLAAGVQQGRALTTHETSLADELAHMSTDQIQQALKEQQDVNGQLRSYIDGILLNIVDNYPQLLEVKQRTA